MSEAEANTIDEGAAKRWMHEIERCDEELSSERGAYMARCKGIRDRVKDIYERASSDGVPRTALKTLRRERELIRKINSLKEGLDAEDIDLVDQVREALGPFGDLPLGAAAVEAAEASTPARTPRKAKKDALNSLIDDEDAHVAANVEAIEAGISELKH